MKPMMLEMLSARDPTIMTNRPMLEALFIRSFQWFPSATEWERIISPMANGTSISTISDWATSQGFTSTPSSSSGITMGR